MPRGAQDADRIACREHVYVTRARDYLGSQREWIGSHAVYGSRAARYAIASFIRKRTGMGYYYPVLFGGDIAYSI